MFPTLSLPVATSPPKFQMATFSLQFPLTRPTNWPLKRWQVSSSKLFLSNLPPLIQLLLRLLHRWSQQWNMKAMRTWSRPAILLTWLTKPVTCASKANPGFKSLLSPPGSMYHGTKTSQLLTMKISTTRQPSTRTTTLRSTAAVPVTFKHLAKLCTWVTLKTLITLLTTGS